MCPTCGISRCSWRAAIARALRFEVFALVRRHAGGRVALDVLDRTEAFAHRKSDVGGRDVVLPIDERLAGDRAIRLWQCPEPTAGVQLRRPCRPGTGSYAAAGLGGSGGHEYLGLGIPAQLAARLREQVHARVKPPQTSSGRRGSIRQAPPCHPHPPSRGPAVMRRSPRVPIAVEPVRIASPARPRLAAGRRWPCGAGPRARRYPRPPRAPSAAR